MLNHDLSFKLWDLANLTVAFSVAQAMSFFYMASEKGKLTNLVENSFAQCFTLTLSLMGYAIYLGLIWACKKGAEELLSGDGWSKVEHVWSVATKIRCLIVILFMVLSLIIYCRIF